jgi:hypothetical protein
VRIAQLSFILWFGVGIGCAELDDEEFNEQIIACEEAFAHLETCCGELDEHVRCDYIAPTYEQLSCDSPMLTMAGKYPDIGPESSKCYRALSCTQVRERGHCESLRGTGPFQACG